MGQPAMTDWLQPYEAPDWHAIAASRSKAARAARDALGAHAWTEPMKVPLPDWLVPDLLQRKAIHMFSSDKGCYKTWLGLSLMMGGIYGAPVLGQAPTRKFSTVYVAADSPDWDIGQQLRKITLALEVKDKPFADSFVLPFGIQFTNEGHVNTLADLIVSHDIDHLAIDVKGYTQGQLDENSDTEQMLYYRVMKMFRDKLGCAVSIFHHFGKINKTARGAGTVEQAAEHAFHLFKTKTGVKLYREKIRGDELWTERLFTLGHHNGGRLLVPIEAALSPESAPVSSVANCNTDQPAEPTVQRKKDRILSALVTSKSRDQLLLIAISDGKDRKWLDNRLQYLRRKKLIGTDGEGNWHLLEAPDDKVCGDAPPSPNGG